MTGSDWVTYTLGVNGHSLHSKEWLGPSGIYVRAVLRSFAYIGGPPRKEPGFPAVGGPRFGEPTDLPLCSAGSRRNKPHTLWAAVMWLMFGVVGWVRDREEVVWLVFMVVDVWWQAPCGVRSLNTVL